MVSVELCAVVEGIHRVRQKAESVEHAMVFSFWRSCSQHVRRVTESGFFRNVAVTFTNRILLLGIGFVASVIVARVLGPEGRGAYAVAVAIGAIGVQFCNLGLHASNTYTVAKKPELLSTLVVNSAVVGIGLGGVVAAAVGLVFSLHPTLAPLHGLLLWLSLCWLPFGLCYLLFQNLLLDILPIPSVQPSRIGKQDTISDPYRRGDLVRVRDCGNGLRHGIACLGLEPSVDIHDSEQARCPSRTSVVRPVSGRFGL